MGRMNTTEVNVVTWVVSDVIQGSRKEVMSCKMGRQSVFIISHRGHQSVFTISLHGRQNIITIICQGRTKIMKDSRMSQKIA